ncbi:MAG: hypothetical protein GXP27_08450, partial [Planctomycetes bacterium]|nr:hypothetical protein [Planctomycetota bacterium]
LAWITLLTVVLYAAVSLGGRIATEGGWAVWSAAGVLKGCAESPNPPPARGGTPFGPGLASRRRIAVLLSVAVLGAYGLAAIQLLPTWELKQHSQRRAVSSEHDPSFGILPPWYLAQTVVPWRWYTPLVNRDEELGRWSAARGMRTNAVEAHLY